MEEQTTPWEKVIQCGRLYEIVSRNMHINGRKYTTRQRAQAELDRRNALKIERREEKALKREINEVTDKLKNGLGMPPKTRARLYRKLKELKDGE